MAKRKRTKGQTMIYKILHRKLKNRATWTPHGIYTEIGGNITTWNWKLDL